MGQMEMKCIFNIGKNISMWPNVSQVSDVAHEPLVSVVGHFWYDTVSCYLHIYTSNE
jgi:hypothetical protein